LLHLVNTAARNNKGACISPFLEFDLNGFPVISHFLYDFLDAELLLGVLGNLLQFGKVLENVLDLDEFFYYELHLRVYLETGEFAHVRPVALFHAGVGEHAD
jgi:hypothetical protein